jgi:transposase-like protein
MITVDTIGRVRRAYFVRGHKIKAIARELKIARNTVRDIVREWGNRAALPSHGATASAPVGSRREP